MKKVSPPDLKNPTVSRPKVVAPRSERSRFIRQALATLLRFIRKKRSLPDVEGDLSAWILLMHGFGEKKWEGGPLEPCQKDIVPAAAAFVNDRLGPEMDQRQIAVSVSKSQRIVDENGPKMAEAYGRGNLQAFQSLFSGTASELMDAAGVPRSVWQHFGVSFDQFIKLRRATRATLICLALQNEHPLILISRAAKGDRAAVLSLVKIDQLFLQSSCCAETIRKATLQNDYDFIRKLTKALDYEPKLSRRDAFHVYYYILLLLENWGVFLPTLHELWITLDPYGREYDSLSAFEKDFQRRRQTPGFSARPIKRSPYSRR
jgi:hypothetical protein